MAATHTMWVAATKLHSGVTLIIKRNTLSSNKLFVPHLFLQVWPEKEADKDTDDQTGERGEWQV